VANLVLEKLLCHFLSNEPYEAAPSECDSLSMICNQLDLYDWYLLNPNFASIRSPKLNEHQAVLKLKQASFLQEHQKILKNLNDENIGYIPIRSMYPLYFKNPFNFTNRMDADLLVSSENLWQAVSVLGKMGYRSTLENTEESDRIFYLTKEINTLQSVLTLRSCFNEMDPDYDSSDWFEKARSHKDMQFVSPFKLLSPEDYFVYLVRIDVSSRLLTSPKVFKEASLFLKQNGDLNWEKVIYSCRKHNCISGLFYLLNVLKTYMEQEKITYPLDIVSKTINPIKKRNLMKYINLTLWYESWLSDDRFAHKALELLRDEVTSATKKAFFNKKSATQVA